MNTILQVEFSITLLAERKELLQGRGYTVVSAFGSSQAKRVDLEKLHPDLVVIGHGAPREEREHLIAYFRNTSPRLTILALLRRDDAPFPAADSNCRADNPPLWERMIASALAKA